MKTLFCIVFFASCSFTQSTLQFIQAIKNGQDPVDGLRGAISATVSPDNKNVYVASDRDNAVAVFNRNEVTGALTYSTCFKDGQGGVDGLSGAKSVAVSPDNKNVYAAGSGEDSGAVAVFNRNEVTGALTFSKCFKEGQGGVDGLYYVSSVTVSPDNKNVYAASCMDDAVVVFNRDAVTGALAYSTCFKNGRDGVDGLHYAYSVIVSPDNKNVYVAGYGHAVAVFNRDKITGALAYSTCFKDDSNGVNGLNSAHSLAVSPDNKNVYVAGSGDNSLAIFNRDTATGALRYGTCLTDDSGGVDGLQGARSIIVSPDNKNVYVISFGDSGAVAVFNRDIATGALTYRMCFRDGLNGTDGLDGASCVAVSPDNKNVYVSSGSTDDAVAVFGRNPETGSLTYSTCFKDGLGVNGLYGISSVVVSPDNKNVFATSRLENAIGVFNRDSATGALAYSTWFKDGQNGVDGLYGAYSAAVSPDDKNVYAAGSLDDALAVFNRDAVSGAITYTACLKGMDGIHGAYSVVVSPDNKNAYVASSEDNAIVSFHRNAVTGALTSSTCHKDGYNADGLYDARSAAVSPDNKNVYVAGYVDNAVAVFDRDTVAGENNYSTCLKDGQDGVDGLFGASSVIVSPDNKNVYVASWGENAVAVFNRNIVTGALTYSTCFKGGAGSADGLYGARAVTVSPDNKNVFVAGDRGTIAIFSRDLATGALTYSTCIKDGQGGVAGLGGALSIAVSPDNKNVYVAGAEDSAIAIFRLVPATKIRPVAGNTALRRNTFFAEVCSPSNSVAKIRYRVPVRAHVRITAYNMQGRLLGIAFDGLKEAGNHCVAWDTGKFGPGVYYFNLTSGCK